MVARRCGFARIEVRTELGEGWSGSAAVSLGRARLAANRTGPFAELVRDLAVTEWGSVPAIGSAPLMVVTSVRRIALSSDAASCVLTRGVVMLPALDPLLVAAS